MFAVYNAGNLNSVFKIHNNLLTTVLPQQLYVSVKRSVS